MNISFPNRMPLLVFVLPLLMAVTLSGCVLFGLGAAAGAAVGGCALLDQNEDDTITQAELSMGIFEEWDTDDNDMISEAEFEAGIDRADIYSEWDGNFDTWDTDDDDMLSESEFESGVAGSDIADWADRECDELGL